MEKLEIQKNIEAILFWKGEPIKIKDLAKILKMSEIETKNILAQMQEDFSLNRGVQINSNDDQVALVTNSNASEIIEQLQKEELDKDLSKSALETLAIIIYRGPIRKSEIDFIRGVNSQFILRNLLIRGLIEKVINPNDERGYLYKSSLELLNFLGISDIKKIENYVKVNEEIQTFIDNQENDTKK